MCVFKTSLELRVNGVILVMRMSFRSRKEINIKEFSVSGSAGLRTRSINPHKVLDY